MLPWPLNVFDLVWKSDWLSGGLWAALSGFMYSLGLILIRKACNRITGGRSGPDSSDAEWSKLLRTKFFWLGLSLYLLTDPMNYCAMKWTLSSRMLALSSSVVMLTNFFLSYAFLYEHFKWCDTLSMTVCSICSGLMNVAVYNRVPNNSLENETMDAVTHVLQDSFSNVGFTVYTFVWMALFLVCLYLLQGSLISSYQKPVAQTGLAILGSTGFRLTSKVCTTLSDHGDAYRSGYFIKLLVFFFILKAIAVCEGVRHMPCRFFLPALVIGVDVLVQIQFLLFFNKLNTMDHSYQLLFAGSSVVACFSICCISLHGGVTLPSPPENHLLESFAAKHGTITHIIDEYKARLPEASQPADLKLVGMQPEKFAGMRQQYPILWLLFVVCMPIALYMKGYTFTTFLICTGFSILQGWKMSAFVPLFTYVGIKKMQRYRGADFHTLYKDELEDEQIGAQMTNKPKWEDVVHFVIVTAYNEKLDDLRMTLTSIKHSKIAQKQIGVILAMEEAEGESAKVKARTLVDEFSSAFLYIFPTYHPSVLKNGVHPSAEVTGKSANAQWSARRLLAAIKGQSLPERANGKHSQRGCLCIGTGSAAAPRTDAQLTVDERASRAAKKKEIEKAIKDQEAAITYQLSGGFFGSGSNINLANVVLTVGDADSEFHHSYFEALTYHFLWAGGKENTTPMRYLTMWQPPIVHMKNFLTQPWPVRLTSVITSAHELSNLADPNATRVAYSTYSLSAKLAEAMDGWDPDWITEDWHTTVKVFLTTSGRLRVMPIFLPILNSTPDVQNEETGKVMVWATIESRWSQAKRHALGFSELVFMHEHILRVWCQTEGLRGKALFVWRAFFMWFKLMWIHTFVAIFPIFAPLNSTLIAFFDKHQVGNTTSINSWSFLLNCIFQAIGLISSIFLFIVAVLLFEAVKDRVDGVYEKGDVRSYAPSLATRWKSPLLNFLYFTVESLPCLPFILVAFSITEWRSAIKTALTKGGGFVYVSAAMGQQAAARK